MGLVTWEFSDGGRTDEGLCGLCGVMYDVNHKTQSHDLIVKSKV